MIERHLLDPVERRALRPPDLRQLGGTEVRHVHAGRDGQREPVDRGDPDPLRLPAPDAAGGDVLEHPGGRVTDQDASRIRGVVQLVENDRHANGEARRRIHRDLCRALGISTGPHMEVADLLGGVPRPGLSEHVLPLDAHVPGEATAAVSAVELQEGPVRSGSAKRHVVLAAEVETGDVVRARIEKDDLIGGTCGDRGVDLCRRRPGIQRGTDRRPIGDAPCDALVAGAPVDGARAVDDSGPPLGVRQRGNAHQEQHHETRELFHFALQPEWIADETSTARRSLSPEPTDARKPWLSRLIASAPRWRSAPRLSMTRGFPATVP